MTYSRLRDRKNKICDLAGVKKIRIHDFRHSCASLLISKGANVTLVAKYLGHSKIEETLNTYSHMFESDLNNLINTINKISDFSNDNLNMFLNLSNNPILYHHINCTIYFKFKKVIFVTF